MELNLLPRSSMRGAKLLAFAWILVPPVSSATHPWRAACFGQAVAPSTKPAAEAPDKTPPEDETVLPAPKLPDPVGAKRLTKREPVWVDAKERQVLVDGYVSLREGFLEMFACKVGTKEHESIVAINSRAQTIHAALLAMGAKEGTPVQFTPEFRPPTGTEIDIEVRWLDEGGKWTSANAQEWVRDSRTKKDMTQPWVFVGSGFWKDPETGKEFYMAEQGDVICLSNFRTAMIDVPIASSDSNEGLMFEANPDRVPALGTPVRLVLTPKLEKKQK